MNKCGLSSSCNSDACNGCEMPELMSRNFAITNDLSAPKPKKVSEYGLYYHRHSRALKELVFMNGYIRGRYALCKWAKAKLEAGKNYIGYYTIDPIE